MTDTFTSILLSLFLALVATNTNALAEPSQAEFPYLAPIDIEQKRGPLKIVLPPEVLAHVTRPSEVQVFDAKGRPMPTLLHLMESESARIPMGAKLVSADNFEGEKQVLLFRCHSPKSMGNQLRFTVSNREFSRDVKLFVQHEVDGLFEEISVEGTIFREQNSTQAVQPENLVVHFKPQLIAQYRVELPYKPGQKKLDVETVELLYQSDVPPTTESINLSQVHESASKLRLTTPHPNLPLSAVEFSEVDDFPLLSISVFGISTDDERSNLANVQLFKSGEHSKLSFAFRETRVPALEIVSNKALPAFGKAIGKYDTRYVLLFLEKGDDEELEFTPPLYLYFGKSNNGGFDRAMLESKLRTLSFIPYREVTLKEVEENPEYAPYINFFAERPLKNIQLTSWKVLGAAAISLLLLVTIAYAFRQASRSR